MDANFDNVDDAQFWSWLAGFSDGEACFSLRLTGGHSKAYQPDFIIGLRADDWRLLTAICRRTGLGYTRSIHRKDGNPQFSWRVSGVIDSIELARGLRGAGCGMFSKKRRDFALWAEAVNLLAPYGGGAKSPVLARLEEIKAELHSVKRFDVGTLGEWDGKTGRKTTPRPPQAKPRGFYNARAAKRFWNSEEGTKEKLARQERYSRLTQDQVDEIVARVLAGERRVAIAAEFGISRQLVDRFLRGGSARRDGTLSEMDDRSVGLRPSDPEFWRTEAGQRAHQNQARLRGKLTQQQIDELVERNKNGESASALAKIYGVSKPLALKFIKGNYIRRD